MTSPPKSPSLSALSKLALCGRQRPLRIMVVGQTGVGKSALVVRFLTRRFIGDYDPMLERIYMVNSHLDGDLIPMEIMDCANQLEDSKGSDLEAHIRWADAFLLIYSVTDKCSFDECSRLRFLISYNKRRRKNLLSSGWSVSCNENHSDVPVILVGNKADQLEDRMVQPEEGFQRSKELQCDAFHEISVRENVDDAKLVIEDLYKYWKSRAHSKQRPHSVPITQHDEENRGLSFFARKHLFALTRHTESMEIIDEGRDVLRLPNSLSFGSPPQNSPPHQEFRSRASTDGNISCRKYAGSKSRHERADHLKQSGSIIPMSHPALPTFTRSERRMSMSMRGKSGTDL